MQLVWLLWVQYRDPHVTMLMEKMIDATALAIHMHSLAWKGRSRSPSLPPRLSPGTMADISQRFTIRKQKMRETAAAAGNLGLETDNRPNQRQVDPSIFMDCPETATGRPPQCCGMWQFCSMPQRGCRKNEPRLEHK